MSASYLQELSLATDLPFYPQHSIFGGKGMLAGTLEGVLTVVGLGKHNNSSAVQVLFRYPEGPESATVTSALENAKGKFAKPEVDQTAAHAVQTYTFGKPKTDAVAADIKAMATAMKGMTSGFQGRCEVCKSSSAPLALLDGVPGYYCSGCQEKKRFEQDAVAMEYERQESNLLGGLLLGSGAALVGSLAWGVIAYLINYIFLYGAILIGVLVAKAVHKGMGKINTAGQVMVAVLTLVSVLFGDVIFYTLTAMRDFGLPFSLELVGAIITNFWEIETEGSGPISVLFALIGAGYILYTNRKPKFAAQFEPLGEPEHPQARGMGAGS